MNDVPFATHRFLIEPISGLPHVSRTTGANLRIIMLLTEKNRICDLKSGNVDFAYHTINEADEWKIDFVKELIDVKNDNLNVAGMDFDEIEEILEYLCTGWCNHSSP